MRKLLVFGADDFAELARYLFDHDSEYCTEAFVVDGQYLKSNTFSGLPLVAFEKVEEVYPPNQYDMFLAIGYSKVNLGREKKYYEAKKKGYRLATYISSRATTWDTLKIGDNCFVFEYNNIQPFTEIGSNVILWSGNHIGHHSRIGDHVFITSHVVVSGRCRIGNNCFLGVNSTLHDHVMLAPRTVVGAGAVIARDTDPDSVYKPAQTVKQERKGNQLRYFGAPEDKEEK